jgi:hypothetical protein
VSEVGRRGKIGTNQAVVVERERRVELNLEQGEGSSKGACSFFLVFLNLFIYFI